MRKLTKYWKKWIEQAPEVYREVYSRVVGTTEISCGLHKYVVFVLDDGRYVHAAQPFYMVKEDDWKPVIRKGREEMGRVLQAAQLEMCQRAEDAVLAALPEGYAEYRLDNFYRFCAMASQGWYVVLAVVYPSSWFVCADADFPVEHRFCYLEFLIPGPVFRVGRVLRLDGRLMKIVDMRDSGNCLHNPLMRLELLPEGTDLSGCDCWGSV